MEISLLASNVENGSLASSLLFAGHMAGICYLKEHTDSILSEDAKKTMSRVNMLLENEHQSPFEHIKYTFLMEGIPKILAMILNNEQVYCTSEKSARYTNMEVDGIEADFYNKWQDILKKEISKEYPSLPIGKLVTLSWENARYGISVFSPATVMAHSIDLRQLNCIIGRMENFIACHEENDFNFRLVPILKEFCVKMSPWRKVELSRAEKHTLSLFAQRIRCNEYGEMYSMSYRGSFAQLAQAHRHRPIKYEFRLPHGKSNFYVPPIIATNKRLKCEWLHDMAQLAHLYPQGLLVEINERGALEDFIDKCSKRLCGQVQLEIMRQTKKNLHAYCENTKVTKRYIYLTLLPYTRGPRCKLGYTCKNPCNLGPAVAFSRKV